MKIQSTVLRVLLILLAVSSLGAFAIVGSVTAYHAQHRGQHRERLHHLRASHPSEPELYAMLGTPWQAGSTNEAIALAKENWGGPTFSISPELARRAPRALIYLVGDMVYLLFIDSSGNMVDFVLLYN